MIQEEDEKEDKEREQELGRWDKDNKMDNL